MLGFDKLIEILWRLSKDWKLEKETKVNSEVFINKNSESTFVSFSGSHFLLIYQKNVQKRASQIFLDPI